MGKGVCDDDRYFIKVVSGQNNQPCRQVSHKEKEQWAQDEI